MEVQAPPVEPVGSTYTTPGAEIALVGDNNHSTQPRDGRAHGHSGDSVGLAVSIDGFIAAAASSGRVGVESTNIGSEVVAVSEAELELRAAIMFVVGATAPAVSGRRGFGAEVVTKDLVHCCCAVVNKLSIKPLSQSFGNFDCNFDKPVAMGWLLGDLVLGCLLPHSNAFEVGRKAANMAPGLKAEFAAPRRRAGKKRFLDGHEGQTRRAHIFEEAGREEAEVRGKLVDLPFPTAAACRRWQAAAQLQPAADPVEEDPVPQEQSLEALEAAADALQVRVEDAERVLAKLKKRLESRHGGWDPRFKTLFRPRGRGNLCVLQAGSQSTPQSTASSGLRTSWRE